MTTRNPILLTDSYKPSHYKMLLPNTEFVYSYGEAREGAKFDEVVFFGLQAVLMRTMTNIRLFEEYIADARGLYRSHLGPDIFNEAGWKRMLSKHGGGLPIEIWAVPEGSINLPGAPLYTAVNTDAEFPWLTSYLESVLMHLWYPTTVASLSRSIKRAITHYLMKTNGSLDGIDFMLHDFGFRGATTPDAAAIGGLAHLVNFKGTDTVAALWEGVDKYHANIDDLGFSVPAAEHTIMTQLGCEGESQVVGHILNQFPTGILAAPIDSYDYMNYVEKIAGVDHYDTIMSRDGKFVFRPDSVSAQHPTPEEEMVWLADKLWDIFGGTTNDLGYRVLDPHVGMIWGDGIDAEGIDKILYALVREGYAASNVVFGMGGGLLQKVNRDTERFAFKCSAQYRDGQWHDIKKAPLDATKASKAGRFDPEKYGLELVYRNGKLERFQNFDDIRARAALTNEEEE